MGATPCIDPAKRKHRLLDALESAPTSNFQESRAVDEKRVQSTVYYSREPLRKRWPPPTCSQPSRTSPRPSSRGAARSGSRSSTRRRSARGGRSLPTPQSPATHRARMHGDAVAHTRSTTSQQMEARHTQRDGGTTHTERWRKDTDKWRPLRVLWVCAMPRGHKHAIDIGPTAGCAADGVRQRGWSLLTCASRYHLSGCAGSSCTW
jgi:hypothetical protein